MKSVDACIAQPRALEIRQPLPDWDFIFHVLVSATSATVQTTTQPSYEVENAELDDA